MPHNTLSEADSVHWSAPEYPHQEKSSDWFWVLGIIASAIVFVSFIFKNILLAILIALSAFTVAMFASKKPKNVRFMITEHGIHAGNEIYPWESLESFGIVLKERGDILILKSEKFFAPHISIPLNGTDTNTVRNIIAQTIPEQPHTESVGELLMEFLGF